MPIRKNILPILTLLALAYLAINDAVNGNHNGDVNMALAPLVIASLIAGGAQVLKGVGNMISAKRQKNFAENLSKRGTALTEKAFSERKDYQIPEYLKQNQALAMNQMYDRSVQEAMQRNVDLSAGNVASQISRSASTSGQAAAGALAAEQMRMQGYNQAALSGAQQRNIGLQAAMSANQALAGAENMAYQYNTMLPFTLNYERGVNLENQGIQGRVVADQQRAAAFADMMNGLSSAALTYGVNAPQGSSGAVSGFKQPFNPIAEPTLDYQLNTNPMGIYKRGSGIGINFPANNQSVFPSSRIGVFNQQSGRN